MVKQKINLPTVTNPNPANGQTSIVTVPGGYRVHQVLISATASTGTNLPSGNWVGDIRVKLGGKVQRLHSAVELNQINTVNGAAYGLTTVGSSTSNYGQVIPVFFAEPWRNDNTQGVFLAWDTSPGQLLEIEIDINGTPTGTAPVITISAVAVVDIPGTDYKPSGLITKVFRSDFASAANLDITTLDRRDIYQALYIAAANISRAILKANNTPIHELTKAFNGAFLGNMGLAAKFDYDLVLDADDAIQSGLNAAGLNDLQLRIEQSSAAAIRVLSQRLGRPE